MLKKIRHFFRDYIQFGLVLISVIVALGLQFTGYQTATHWVLGVSAILNVFPLVWGMYEDFRSGSWGLDVLAITAIVASVILKEYWAAMIVVLMLTGGEALEDYAERRAKKELTSLLSRKPTKAHIIRKGKTVDVKASEIKGGDVISILPGEVVPVDAVIQDGESSFDEANLTGESLPVVKKAGDVLLSGSVNIEGAITAKASATAADSQYEQIIKLVKSAASSQAPFVRLADRYAVPFTVFAYLLAGGAWAISGAPIRFLQVIIVATPCPLLLAAPIALISGMSRSARYGIIVKTGSSLERLAEVKTVAFDKTGTLTQGKPVVDQVVTFNKLSKEEVLSLAAAVEQSSNHILAKAIVTAAGSKNVKVTGAKQVKEVAGRGIEGRIQGKTVLVGRLSFIKDAGIEAPTKVTSKAVTQTATFVAVNDQLAGMITFKDEIRSESKSMLKRLRHLGIRHILMVTGDNAQTAKQIAKKLGIEQVEAECLPGDKIRAVEAVKDRPVAFVGDGVNDAPVLTASEVGIALGARGSTAASESADVVIMLDDVSRVATAIDVAKRTFFIAKQSILIGISISLGLMVIFATGKFKPITGAFLQEVVDVVVILNALRAHNGALKEL
jgi:heavy metal translocating P-type ATPase